MPKPYSGIQGLDLPDDWYYLLRSVQRHLDVEGLPVPPPLNGYEVAELHAALKGQPRVYRPLSGPPSIPAADETSVVVQARLYGRLARGG